MKYIVFLITILLTGCMDSLEYVQLENKSNYKYISMRMMVLLLK
jgi:hypothetical protein